MNILAVDASTKSSGWSIYKHNKLIDYGCVKSSSTDLFKRINIMVNEIRHILQQNLDIQYLILEQVQPDKGPSIKTHKALMFLQGAINMLIYNQFKGVTVQYLYPSEWRKVCGISQGRGITREVLKKNDIKWANSTFNIECENDDIADAIGLGYAYINK